MWPWEHVVFGYLLYSVGVHLVERRRPREWCVAAVAVGTLVPDLVDKPLAWTFGVFRTGYGPAHSVLVTVPALVALFALADRRDHLGVAVAYAVGHLSHFAGDLVYPLLFEGILRFDRLLWPVATFPAPDSHGPGLWATTFFYLRRYLFRIHELDAGPLLVFELALLSSVFLLWLYDGAPVVRGIYRHVRRSP